MKVNFACALEINLEVERRGTESGLLGVECKVSTVSDVFGVPGHLLVFIHCVFLVPRSTQPSTRKLWSTSCFLLLTNFMEMQIFQQDLTPEHRAKATWFKDHGITVPNWPANSPDLNPIENR